MMISVSERVENLVEKAETTGYQRFPILFSTLSKKEIFILATLNLSSANAFKCFQIGDVKNFVIW